MPVGSAISNGFRAFAEFFGLRRERQALQNTPQMQANAQARTDAATADSATATVNAAMKTGDLDQLRKDAAE